MSPLIKSDAKVQLLSSIPLFTKCNARQLRRIAALTVALDVPDGQVLCREGQIGTEFFVIIEGEAAVTVRGRHKANIGGGGFCGEMAILDGGPRVASVTTTAPTKVLVLSRREFEDLLAMAPEIAFSLLQAMAQRLREADLANRGRRAGAPIGA
jgi:CRP-like cAMP-binding protein